VTRIAVDAATMARLDETFVALVLVTAYVCGPPWTWPTQWRQARRRVGPTQPRRAASRGRTPVRVVLAELEPAPASAPAQTQARYVARPAGRHVALGAQ
jgi:hypothetical protein